MKVSFFFYETKLIFTEGVGKDVSQLQISGQKGYKSSPFSM